MKILCDNSGYIGYFVHDHPNISEASFGKSPCPSGGIYLIPLPSSIADAVGSSLIRYNLPSFKLGQTTRTLQTDIALKLDFPDKLCRAAFAILAMLYCACGTL